jgi:NTP pyrophosphatase (non-canonical NTP hydrolase)
MKSEKYIEKVLEKENDDFEGIAERLQGTRIVRLLHAAIGLSTEAGELLDAIKKHVFYGRELDVTNVIEELGDACFYLGIGLDETGITWEEIFQRNMDKLDGRYKDKFTEDEAINRDLDAEREILEGGDV